MGTEKYVIIEHSSEETKNEQKNTTEFRKRALEELTAC
jgi:hypothetical protein